MTIAADTLIRTRRRFTSTGVVLISLCTLIAVGRLRFIRDLPDWDVATYALIGGEVVGGDQLYADVWDMKPPAIFASFALAEWITRGSHAWAAYLLSALAATVTAIAIYRVGSSHDRAAGLWAAALWTCVSLQPAIGGYLPNTEAFINACLAVALAAMLRRRLVLAGIALALATLFKQVAIAPAIALAAWALFSRRERPRRVIIMLAMIPLMWISVFAYFAVTGRGELFYETNFVYSRFYGGSIVANLVSAFRPAHLFPREMIELLPLLLMGLAGGLARRQRALICALLIGSFVAIAMPGPFFAHYYQLWLVPLAFAGGAVAAKHRVVGAIACIGLVVLQAHWWTSSPRDRAKAMHPASFFVSVADTGNEIRQLLQGEETMFAWCDEVQLYWLADKHPPGPGLWEKHMTEGPLADALTQQTLRQLQKNPPDLVVTLLEDRAQHSHPIDQWIAERYSPIPGNANRLPLALHARNGSELSKRTNAALP